MTFVLLKHCLRKNSCSSLIFLSPFLCKTMIALDMDKKVRKPQFELDSEQVRYEHRFAPFNSVVTPPPVHYIQFKVLFFSPLTSCELFYTYMTVNKV